MILRDGAVIYVPTIIVIGLGERVENSPSVTEPQIYSLDSGTTLVLFYDSARATKIKNSGCTPEELDAWLSQPFAPQDSLKTGLSGHWSGSVIATLVRGEWSLSPHSSHIADGGEEKRYLAPGMKWNPQPHLYSSVKEATVALHTFKDDCRSREPLVMGVFEG